jgi:hypothetical protein
MNPVWVSLLLAAVIWSVAWTQIWGKRTTVTLLPYQRGVVFRKGYAVRDVGPGKHPVRIGRELLVHGDVRPITVNYEKLVVGLQDGFSALYGLSASVEVQDIRKAIYSARNYADVPHATLLRCARLHLSACFGKSLPLEKDAVSNRIAEDAKARLNSAGFKLISFRITELAIGTVQPPAPKAGPSLSA